MLKELVKTRLQGALEALGLPEPPAYELKRSERLEHGDLSTNVAFALAKQARQAPHRLAEQLVEQLRAQSDSPFESVKVAGAGFVNFSFKLGKIHQVLAQILAQAAGNGVAYGTSSTGEGQTAQVEFVSANPTGPLTLGHGRQAILGDVIARLLENAGYQVTREFYYNNAGRQMRLLGQSVQARYLEGLGRPAQFPEEGYHGEYIREIAQKIRAAEGDAWAGAETGQFKDYAEAEIFAGIRRTLGRLFRRPADQAFDIYYNESSLYGRGPQRPLATVDRITEWLRAAGLAYDKDGAVWFKATASGRPEDRVIVRRSGEPTYRLPDIAYHLDKLARGFDLIIDIFGADHHDTYQDVLAALKELCQNVPELEQYEPERIRVLIHQFVTLTRGGQQVKMSKRLANYVTIDDLIDELATTVELEKQTQEAAHTSEQLREAFAVNAVRYFFLMRNPDSHLQFDFDLAKAQSKENPVYYVMYAHTRIAAINAEYFTVFTERNTFRDPAAEDLSLLQQPEELALIKQLDAFPEVLAEALDQLRPNLITGYAFELARRFHDFYEQHRVVDASQPELSEARMALLRGIDIVFGRLFGLLGLFAPRYM